MSSWDADKWRDEEDARKARERVSEYRCRRRFLTEADHTECVCNPPCSRYYNPMPYPEAVPTPMDDYIGTGVGSLYGLGMASRHVMELAGWTLTYGGM